MLIFSLLIWLSFVNFISTQSECGKNNLGGSSGVIKSPNYPDHYFDSNTRCDYPVSTPEGTRVCFQILDLDVENSTVWDPEDTTCAFDVVEIYNGNSSKTGKLLGKWCGKNLKDFVKVKSNQGTVSFKVDFVDNYRGFLIAYGICQDSKCQLDNGKVSSTFFPTAEEEGPESPADLAQNSDASSSPTLVPSSIIHSLPCATPFKRFRCGPFDVDIDVTQRTVNRKPRVEKVSVKILSEDLNTEWETYVTKDTLREQLNKDESEYIMPWQGMKPPFVLRVNVTSSRSRRGNDVTVMTVGRGLLKVKYGPKFGVLTSCKMASPISMFPAFSLCGEKGSSSSLSKFAQDFGLDKPEHAVLYQVLNEDSLQQSGQCQSLQSAYFSCKGDDQIRAINACAALTSPEFLKCSKGDLTLATACMEFFCTNNLENCSSIRDTIKNSCSELLPKLHSFLQKC